MRCRPARPRAHLAVAALVASTAVVGCATATPVAIKAQEPSTTTTSAPPAPSLPIATSTSTSSTSSTTSTSVPPDELPVPITALPAGFSLVSTAPSDAVRVGRSWEYGTWTGLAMTTDDAGVEGAVVAFTHVVDLATGTTALQVARWNRDDGTWASPAELQRGRLSPTLAGTAPVAMATGDGQIVGVVTEVQDEQGRSQGITLRTSDDGGDGWRSETVTSRPASAPSAAIHQGVAVVGFWQAGDLVVATKDLSADAGWVPVVVPLPEGTMAAGSGPVVAVAPDGRIGVGAVVDGVDGTGRRVVWWDGVADAAHEVVPLPAATSPADVPPSLATVWGPAGPVLAIGDGSVADGSDVTAAAAVVTSTDGGASFGAPAGVGADGPPARPIGLSLASSTAPATTPAPWALAFMPDTTDRGDCGLPKVAVGTSPTAWQPCLEDPPSRRIVATGLGPAVAYDAQGRLNLAVTVAASDGRLEPGVYLWRAPS